LYFRSADFYRDQKIDLRTGLAVIAIDRPARRLTLSDGTALPYGILIIATGSTPIRLPERSGGQLGGVYCMRDLADADSIAKALQPGRRVLVVGGGYIGLEGAAVAIKLGLSVTLVEAGARILGRVACAETAAFFRDLHTGHGVGVREGVSLSQLRGEGGQVCEAMLSDGSRIPCDVVLVGIGVRPNQALAEAAGLELDNGIKTDARCRTSDPDIFAVGDCASFPHGETRLQLESVGHAIDHAETAASVIMGADVNFRAKPWFWSDQYDVKLQIAGLSAGYDEIIARKTVSGGVSFWYFAADILLAVDAMNDPRAYMVARRLIEAGKSADKAKIVDANFDVKTMLTAR
jgi:3-phenylpropionate/trans-cinnamate dioxygenase ferredoxin reductase subunit